ncbi:DUF1566 domain-containing protein [Thiothrix lacustris]|uniref:DUF1566 domain-containing protein n=2 Tax=Thiothrix lacustris TaxID=525917 RepID=A0ABY9MRR4_9GAMM|nr:DUF1566 domain-containing protein [Thiothrix lacustris]
MSSLLTACGSGSSGTSAEDLATQAAATAQVAATTAASIEVAKQQVSDALSEIVTDATTAKTVSSAATTLTQKAASEASSYSEVAQSLASTQAYAAQAIEQAALAVAQQAIADQANTTVQSSQSLTEVQQAASTAQTAAATAKTARAAAEEALAQAQKALTQLESDIASALASRRYTKLDSYGNTLSANADSWACVKDNNTGLVWEEKTSDGGLRDKKWRYRHMHNYPGYGNLYDYNGVQLCAVLGTCDSYTYRDAVNSEGLCGRKGVWRLPRREELGSIAQINDGQKTPHINQSIFPETANIPDKSAYCAENMAKTAADCGYAAGTELHYTSDGRIECNYQGVDYTKQLVGTTQQLLEQSILVALRQQGEVPDGMTVGVYPNANWVCYTRLVSSQ